MREGERLEIRAILYMHYTYFQKQKKQRLNFTYKTHIRS